MKGVYHTRARRLYFHPSTKQFVRRCILFPLRFLAERQECFRCYSDEFRCLFLPDLQSVPRTNGLSA